MTKEQYLKVIETIIRSPRNDTQKITMLKYSFETYVEDISEESKMKDTIIESLLDALEQEHTGLRALIALEIENRFGIGY